MHLFTLNFKLNSLLLATKTDFTLFIKIQKNAYKIVERMYCTLNNDIMFSKRSTKIKFRCSIPPKNVLCKTWFSFLIFINFAFQILNVIKKLKFQFLFRLLFFPVCFFCFFLVLCLLVCLPVCAFFWRAGRIIRVYT